MLQNPEETSQGLSSIPVPWSECDQSRKHFPHYACELDNAYTYEHNLTLTMFETILLAGGNDNEDYRMYLCIKKKEPKNCAPYVFLHFIITHMAHNFEFPSF